MVGRQLERLSRPRPGSPVIAEVLQRALPTLLGLLSVAVFLLAPDDSPVQVASFFVPLLLATGLLWFRLATGAGSSRLPLTVLTIAVTAYAAATLVWYLVPAFGQALPFPSPVDLAYFCSYAGFAAFLLIVLRRSAVDGMVESRVAVIDAVLLTLAMAAVLWVLAIQPSLAPGASTITQVTATMYPVCTLVLFGLAARLSLARFVVGSIPGLLVVGWIGCEIVGDALYAVASARGTFVYAHPSTAIWMIGYTSLAAFCAHPAMTGVLSGENARRRTGDGMSELVGRLPRPVWVAVLASAAVVPVLLAVGREPDSEFLRAASVAAVVLVTYRASLFAGDLQRERLLTGRLDQAMELLQEQHQELARQSAEMEHQAMHDPVTGLGNRAMVRHRAAQVGQGEGVALLLLDLDGFKEVNDTLGHAAGDTVLREVGKRLARMVGDDDTVARLGGDEFAVLLPGVDTAAAGEIAERMLEEFRAPYAVEGTALRIRGSIGVTAQAGAVDIDELLREADLAMYAAKGAGKDTVRVFEPVMLEEARERLLSEAELRAAVADRQFAVYYQPVVDASDGSVRSIEALVRWDHPTRGILPPAEFLPMAERTGLIVDIGRQVLEESVAQVTRWRADWPQLTLAVNVSEPELLHPGFVGHVEEVLRFHELDPSALNLEVTEGVVAQEQNIAGVLAPLVALGVQFSIDDFGAGHSSLNRLRQLNVERLKIDKSFVAEVDDHPDRSAPLLASIISLAHSIGRRVVAEGVETNEQASFLTAHGCDELQGYFFSRPVASAHVLPLLLATGLPLDGPVAVAPGPDLAARLMDRRLPVHEVLPELLEQLSRLSGLPCCFVTEVDGEEDSAVQVTRYAHNATPHRVRIARGDTVPWVKTLCHRLLSDDLEYVEQVNARYPGHAAARETNVESYVSMPIRNGAGELRGTLGAASDTAHAPGPDTLKLFRLFADAIGWRLDRDAPSRRPPTDERG